jgi:hypothetical protein
MMIADCARAQSIDQEIAKVEEEVMAIGQADSEAIYANLTPEARLEMDSRSVFVNNVRNRWFSRAPSCRPTLTVSQHGRCTFRQSPRIW